MCPNCGRDAPVIYRGALPYCTACGKIRTPLAGAAVHLTGRPSKLGGSVARWVGWLTLFFGLTIALTLGAFFQWLFPAGIVGWALGVGLAAITALVAGGLLKGGSLLHTHGSEAEARTLEEAVFALAAARGGILSTLDVAQALSLPEKRADEMLTNLAKRNADRVRVEVDDNGSLTYQFPRELLGRAKTEMSPAAEALDAEFEEPSSQQQRLRK